MADIRLTRKHAILRERGDQIDLNLKAIDGGKPYIEARLSRHACESDVSWQGSAAVMGLSKLNGVQGRKDRAFYVNYAGRVADKINQLVTSGEVEREGIDPEFRLDATATGVSVEAFMDRISSFVTAAGWAWIGVDRQAPVSAQRSIAEREASGDRVWWMAWRANEVVDWHHAPDGKLDWLITEEQSEETTTPDAKPTKWKIRTIWGRGEGVRLYVDPEKPDEVAKEVQFTFSLNAVPFVCVGVPTSSPWWFDDAEMIGSSLLNLESCNHENLLQAVYPQLVIPSSLLAEVMQQMGVSYHDAIQMVRGLNCPILEPDGAKGLTRYLQPSASDLAAIPNEIIRRRGELFQIVGMALSKESRQVASAEAKRLDLLDVSAVLAKRAAMMEAAETKAVEMSKQMDPAFKDYGPSYPKEFDVGDIKGDLESLLLISTSTLPSGAQVELQKAMIGKLGRIARIPKERVEELMDEASAEPEPSPELKAFSKGAKKPPVEPPA